MNTTRVRRRIANRLRALANRIDDPTDDLMAGIRAGIRLAQAQNEKLTRAWLDAARSQPDEEAS